MMFIQELNVVNCGNGRLLEPRKVIEGQKMFLVLKQQPDSMLRNLSDFNFRSDHHFTAESMLVNGDIQQKLNFRSALGTKYL